MNVCKPFNNKRPSRRVQLKQIRNEILNIMLTINGKSVKDVVFNSHDSDWNCENVTFVFEDNTAFKYDYYTFCGFNNDNSWLIKDLTYKLKDNKLII